MASLTIRNLDDGLKAQLRLQAARHGRSMEEEVRVILAEALTVPSPSADAAVGLGSRIRAHFAELGGVELDLPPRISSPEPAELT
ncbi:plasmid stabilization protein [Synechococcus sp. CS-1326]|uniref:FitA-like ribbon-helix-helix domain-containing protein n=1 Tax=Synechococcus sp. CS-1326 TaxID=2847978 RepID=UPI00223BCF7B|nr:plasmid stabilization protein [Synechococcus sp. CS-1326]MCT0214366.1 plasmid stabilization protein [Synechococcus sp. CS-1326]